ncbi:MAG: flagellar basal body P-ring protein FlgI [Planctomycetota bacterium]
MRARWARYAAAALVLAALATPASGTRLENLVRIKGEEGGKLHGMGLIVGLPGTGDDESFASTHRALAGLVNHFLDETAVPADLVGSGSIAAVSVTVTIPPAGVREGDRLDIEVSALGNATSLRGGQLLVTPLISPPGIDGASGTPMAMASGAVRLVDEEIETRGRIEQGAQMIVDRLSSSVDRAGRVQLVVHDRWASHATAHNLADLINGTLAPDGPRIARAVDSKNLIVTLPSRQQSDPSPFLAQMLSTHVHPSLISRGARVILNEREQSIVIVGDVQLRPVMVSFAGLTIAAGEAAAPPPGAEGFVALDPEDQGGADMDQLLEAMNRLQVPAGDRLRVVRELARAGAIAAEVVEVD